MKQAFRHFIFLAPDEGGESGSSGGRSFGTVSDAVAELDRRDAERRAANKAAKAAKAPEASQEPAQEPDGDADDVEPQDERRKPEKAEKPEKKKAEKAPEPEDDEGEDEDSDEPDESEDDEPDDEPSDKQKRKVATDDAPDDEPDAELEEIEHDGKKHKVPKELKDSFLRQQDYTRKTQEVAEARKTVETSWREAQQTTQQLVQAQNALVQFAQAAIGQPPDLSLAANDPQTYLVQKGLYEQRMAQVSQLMEQGQMLTQQQQALQQRAQAEYLREQGDAMLKAMPELRNEAKRAEFRAAAVELGAKYGFSAGEVSGIADHRMLLVLRDLAAAQKAAARSTQATASVKTKLANVPPKTAKPQAGGDQNSQGRNDEAKRQFLKSGRSMKDVERWLKATER